VHWTDEWRVQCDLQETFKVSRPKASAAPLPKSSLSIQQCLRLFSSPERLDADNLWYCSACKVHRQALKTVKLWRLPEVLVLTLKRFEVRESSVSGWRGASSMNVKIDSPVEFPINGLDLREFCHEAAPLQGGSTYDLFAVCNHFGRMGFGHYTAFARDWAGPSLSEEWSAFDDESVTPSSEEEVLRSMRSAYILFYRKRPVTTVESSHS
jgi:ubiquitin C-terminal hydrolase